MQSMNTNELENTYDEPKPNAYYKRKRLQLQNS